MSSEFRVVYSTVTKQVLPGKTDALIIGEVEYTCYQMVDGPRWYKRLPRIPGVERSRCMVAEHLVPAQVKLAQALAQ